MKISCTTKEKENMKKILKSSNHCPFYNVETNFHCEPGYCNVCFEENIKWDVKDSDGE